MSLTRIAFVTDEWGGETRGGIGEAVRAEVERDPARALVVLDASASVVTRVRKSVPAEARVEHVAARGQGMLPRRVFRSRAHWRSHRIWLALCSIVESEAVESIEFPDFDGPGFVSIKARRLGLGPPLPPVTVRLHGTVARVSAADDRAMLSLEDKQRLAIERYALRHADRIVAPSAAVLDEYADAQPLAPNRAISPPSFERPGIAWSPPPIAEGRPLRIGFLGKLQPLKGPETLLRAASSVFEARGGDALELHLVGADEPGRFRASHAEELRRLVAPEHAGRVHFHGALPREAALRRMADCHAAVVPSRTETFGLAARELASIGLPLAVTDLGAFRDLGDGASGGSIDRFPVDAVDALAQILDRWCRALDAGEWPAAPRGGGGDPVRAVDPPRAPATPEREPPRAEPALVSIVIPFYEMQAYLEACLDSIVADPHPRKEILLVDDGSPSPEARDLLDSIASTFDACELRVVRKANGGLASARNAGVAEARGEFVLPLDPDDLIVPGYLGTAVAALDAHEELCWVNGISAAFADGDDPALASDWVVPYDPTPGMLFYENGCGTAAAVFRRETLEAFPYREELPAYEDWDLQLRLAVAGHAGEGLPAVFHRYRQRPAGLAAAAHVRHADLVARIVAPHLETLPPELRSAFEVYLASASDLRGLGAARAGPSGRAYAWAADLYRHHVKDALGNWVGEVSRDRWVHALRRRWLEASARRRSGR
ncbi:MAG: glycosyltransferase [bacterium]|nr:glycosyltransferase [bacterium]